MMQEKFWILLQLVAISLAGPAVINVPRQNFEKIVMDVDAGSDDAFAISLVIKNQIISNGPPLIAITCVSGNTNIKNVKINVMRTLIQLNRVDIPVYMGANESFFAVPPPKEVFGKDGLCDFYDSNASLPRPQKEHAVTALIRLVSANPGQITLISLAPLTNIALALKLDPNFIRKLKQLVIIGGAAKGIGNVSPGIEFNAFNDPEAFYITLKKSHHTKVTIFPWDLVMEANISMQWRNEMLGGIISDDIKFFNKAESCRSSKIWNLGDGMAVASYIWPKTVKKSQNVPVTAVTCGQARGGLLVDYFYSTAEESDSNVKLILDFDAEEYKRQLLKHFKFNKNEILRKRNNNKRTAGLSNDYLHLKDDRLVKLVKN